MEEQEFELEAEPTRQTAPVMVAPLVTVRRRTKATS